MERPEELLLDALRCAIHGQPLSREEPVEASDLNRMISLARVHNVLPLIVQTLEGAELTKTERSRERLHKEAKRMTIRQAASTAEFLLLLDELDRRDLRPAIMKGMVCRSLYPDPEQRASVDEDFLIPPEEFPRYHAALLEFGLQPVDPGAVRPDAYEISYRNDESGMYLELHLCAFPPDSDAYGDLVKLFEGCLERTTEIPLYWRTVRTLAPTDHLLYLLCHAYKHMLHGGVGIRQICDICLFAREYLADIDWEKVLSSCELVSIDVLAAAMFRIGSAHLGIPAPPVFDAIEADELPLLEDCLSGGLYGADDIDRLHSSTLTLDAVAAGKSGRRRIGILRSLFVPANDLEHRYPYLRRFPWLLPVAWVQRAWSYAMDTDRVDPGRSIQIGAQRIDMLRNYRVIP